MSKFWLVVICLLPAALSQMALTPDMLRGIVQNNPQCLRESHATNAELMAILQGRFSDTPELKNHIFCLGQKLQLLGSDGQFLWDAINEKMGLASLDPSVVEGLMEKCLVTDGDAKDAIYGTIKCVVQNKDMLMKKNIY